MRFHISFLQKALRYGDAMEPVSFVRANNISALIEARQRNRLATFERPTSYSELITPRI